MENLEVTRLSSKGQVVLPQATRNKLHLVEGTKFVVIAAGDTVILKKIEMPTLERAKKMLQLSHAFAKKHGLKQADIKTSIRRVRSRHK